VLVKLMESAIIDPLSYIFNLSLSTGKVPNKMKLAKVIPVFKKGQTDLVSNYRPISLLSIFDKLLEKKLFILDCLTFSLSIIFFMNINSASGSSIL